MSDTDVTGTEPADDGAVQAVAAPAASEKKVRRQPKGKPAAAKPARRSRPKPAAAIAAGSATTAEPASSEGGAKHEEPEVTYEAGATLTDDDRRVIENVERSLKDGLALKEWWEGPGEDYAKCFDVVATYNPADTSYGFFDEAPLDGRKLPVMGIVQEQLYDTPKSPLGYEETAATWMRDQLRQFVLHFFMRVSSFRLPGAYVGGEREPLPFYLRPFDFCSTEDKQEQGFGFQQMFYKRRDTGKVGKFRDDERDAIVDLRTIGDVYEWIVVKVRVFDFKFELKLRQPNSPQLVVPLAEESYLVISPEFVSDWTDGTGKRAKGPDDLLGEYGLGYAFVNDPKDTSFLAYGPGEFEAAYQTINFRIKKSGEIRVHMVFVVNRPTRVVNISLNPVDWGFKMADFMSLGMTSRLLAPVKEALERLPGWKSGVDPVLGSLSAANLLTNGLAGERLCISKEQLERVFLLRHFLQHYQTIAGSLMTWRSTPDWTKIVPDWIPRRAA